MTLGRFLAAMVLFWGHFGHTFCLPKRAGSPKVPQEAPPRIKSQAFGYHFGVKNHKKSFPEAPQTESLKMCRKSVPIGCDFDGLDLAKVWEGCSKSSFSAFEKKSENGGQQASILVPFLEPNRAQLRKNGDPKIVPKKGALPDSNETLFPGREAPGDGPRVRIFNNKEQLLGQQQLQLQQQLQKQLLELMFCSKWLFGSVFEIIVRSRFQELFELLHLLEQDHSVRDLTCPWQRPGEFGAAG